MQKSSHYFAAFRISSFVIIDRERVCDLNIAGELDGKVVFGRGIFKCGTQFFLRSYCFIRLCRMGRGQEGEQEQQAQRQGRKPARRMAQFHGRSPLWKMDMRGSPRRCKIFHTIIAYREKKCKSVPIPPAGAETRASAPFFSAGGGKKRPAQGKRIPGTRANFGKKQFLDPGGEPHSSRRRASRRFWEEKMQGRGGEPCGSAPRPWPPVRRRLSRCTRRRRSRRRRGIRSRTSRGARRGSRPPCRGTACRGSRSSCPRRRARSACGR